MQATIARHALDRIPLSLIIDDSTVLVNLNYFWMRDRNPVDGENRRWEDVPVVHPESFTREWAEFCLEHGVRGKFSVVPCPAALGRIDEGLPLFSRDQQESWLRMCRELIVPAFDITPEMITHSVVVDPKTCRPVEPQLWEQYEWAALPTDREEHLIEYLATACRILDNVGLTPEGVTSPGGFGGRTLEFYARLAGSAVRQVTGNPVPYFFQRVMGEPITAEKQVETPVWYPDRETGQATGEIIASTGDWTGSWTGYGEVNADKYLTADLQGGRVAELVAAGQPVVFISHWQGFYGMHNEDRRGFRALRTVVRRVRELDPEGERTRWRKCSEITRYACAREMATVTVEGQTIRLRLPVLTPELTLSVSGVAAREVLVNGAPLRPASGRRGLASGTFLAAEGSTLLAFDPGGPEVTVEVRA
jgi:hypothetical protein